MLSYDGPNPLTNTLVKDYNHNASFVSKKLQEANGGNLRSSLLKALNEAIYKLISISGKFSLEEDLRSREFLTAFLDELHVMFQFVTIAKGSPGLSPAKLRGILVMEQLCIKKIGQIQDLINSIPIPDPDPIPPIPPEPVPVPVDDEEEEGISPCCKNCILL